MTETKISIIVEGKAARVAPVSAGVPFQRGTVRDVSSLALAGPDGKGVPLQAQALSKWPDGSCRWVLLDFEAAAGTELSLAHGGNPLPEAPVHVTETATGVSFTNGMIKLQISKGAGGATLVTSDGRTVAQIVPVLEIGAGEKRVTSKTVIDSFEVYAGGPLRAAVAVYGRRLYSDGMEGPWSQRLEMFSNSYYVRVEDTFIYAHFPGSHANPQNPLALWKLEAQSSGKSATLEVESLVPDEESEGLMVTEDAVAFWGIDTPFDLSRHTDEELIGEDTPGIALGLGKSCAAAFGLVPKGLGKTRLKRPLRDAWAHTTPEVYAASGALGDFAPERPGEFVEAEEGLKQILGFWLWWQDNDPKGSFDKGPWHGIFDWGDWQLRYTDVHGKPTGWPYYEGRYGWDCNEMDTTLMLWNAFFHAGRPEYWRAAVAMARHMMDVDMINVDYRKYSLPEYVYDPHSYENAPWKEGRDRMFTLNTIGLGRRHNVQHWGNGVGDTRHTWNGGIMAYYYATGNRRAYDAVIAMADMHMQRMWGYAAGEYALSMWCIYNAWQLTGNAKYLEELKYRLGVVAKLQLPDGGIPGHLDFDKQEGYPEVDGPHGCYSSLPIDYLSNALIDYYADTKDPLAKEVAMRVARAFVTAPAGRGDTLQSVEMLRLLCWAWKETGEKEFLERAKYHHETIVAKPLAKWPANAKEWLDFTYDVMKWHGWQIRHVGPGVRMIPYMVKALSDEAKGA
jgi:hypothetical protein